MAVMPLPPPFPATSTKLLKLPTLSHSSLFRSNFITKCEIRSFENHRNWTIEHFSNMNNNNNNNNNSSFSSSLVSASSASQHAMKNSKKVVLFYSAETKSLAYNIASESDAIELRSISWGFVHFLHILWFFFPFNFSIIVLFISLSILSAPFRYFEYPFSFCSLVIELI